MSTMGLVTSLGSAFGAREKSPAATAESVFETRQLRRTGITPSTSVRSSRMNFISSDASSDMMSPMVAVARRLLFVRMLRADTMLFEPVLGMERTEIRSAWLARRVRLVLLRLIMVDVSGFRTDPMIEGVTSENALFSS
jgi:hypothetical protein